jgi:hypothetical protein
MKFTQLQIGQRFLYQGKTYRKVTPLMADPVDGEGQRLIPRSAIVEPLDATPPPAQLPEDIPLAQIDRAMHRLSADINQILADSGLDAESVNALSREMQGAFVRCRHTLNLP